MILLPWFALNSSADFATQQAGVFGLVQLRQPRMVNFPRLHIPDALKGSLTKATLPWMVLEDQRNPCLGQFLLFERIKILWSSLNACINVMISFLVITRTCEISRQNSFPDPFTIICFVMPEIHYAFKWIRLNESPKNWHCKRKIGYLISCFVKVKLPFKKFDVFNFGPTFLLYYLILLRGAMKFF